MAINISITTIAQIKYMICPVNASAFCCITTLSIKTWIKYGMNISHRIIPDPERINKSKSPV